MASHKLKMKMKRFFCLEIAVLLRTFISNFSVNDRIVIKVVVFFFVHKKGGKIGKIENSKRVLRSQVHTVVWKF